ncbi:MAG: precorrin-6y C5,15-methyltransferase (decarboxylating) subunit CbiE [Boseongicola sp. SB0677_bin_26]|nr:precorrin-6y C5,15-methyltransferase (decarboxylating) subunit CbiE [Boseongicola sp. SB0665_bin_10]MYG28814.1 precorrin-6y C5,15-methyltransferase (decarboxylating) subunit CbiE [Boseongicola sp. SB0677_bin_26]
MPEARWLTIIGLGEDGPEGLSPASLEALHAAEVIMGSERHLSLAKDIGAERVTWPVPFEDGLPLLEGLRGRKVAVLASGDPFWFGAGSVIARRFAREEWRAIPGASVFSLAAARLGWPLERVACLGLHAAPLPRLRPHLAAGQRVIATVRDGAAVGELAAYLDGLDLGDTRMHVLEALGGPRERCREVAAGAYALEDVVHPVAVAFEAAGSGTSLSAASGQPDDVFESDGQMTKRPIRAITLSALAPRPGERLWDIGSGSGSVAIEWLMTHASTQAVAIEMRADRAARIRKNARALGQDRLVVVEGQAPESLSELEFPDAVFVGGGLDRGLLDWIWGNLAPRTRVVANAVTLETTALLTEAQARFGGTLTQVELAEAAPVGRFRGWKAAYPVVQWRAVR